MVRAVIAARSRTRGAAIGSLYTNCTIVLLGLVYVAAIFSVRPFLTNDGPVHLAFGNFLTLNAADHPQLLQQYRFNETLKPNLAIYGLIALLLGVFSPTVTESLIQVLCTVGIVAAAWLALRQIARDQTWLTLLVFPLTLHRLFFLGLYNFCLSIAGFFLVLAAFFRLQHQGGWMRAGLAIAALYFTFLSHAAGFLVALLALLVLTSTKAFVAWRGGRRWRTLVHDQRMNLVVVVSALPLVLWSLAVGDTAPYAYGVSLPARIMNMLRLEQLFVHAGSGQQFARLLGPLLLAAVAALAALEWRGRSDGSSTTTHEGARGMLLTFAATTLFALAFPDVLGGGWIHFQRMVLFPFFVAVLALSHLRIPGLVRVGTALFATLASLALISEAVAVQRETVRQMGPLLDVSRLVGDHCSVLPVVLTSKPLDTAGRSLVMRYNPYLQAATRLELTGDRAVLFNYQARIGVYPVLFRDQHDTQALIFGWAPMQISDAVQTIDIERFERASGMPVDFLLRWGPLESTPSSLRASLQRVERRARLVYRSDDGRVSLFRRATAGVSACHE